jgi:abequosyltransferase
MNKYNEDPILLSICIATRNRANYISETLISINNQFNSYINFEIIILDSSNNDSTFKIIQGFKQSLMPIKYIKNEKLNLDEGFDEAVINANGLYCWLLPDDDLLYENAFNLIKDFLHKNYDLILLNLKCFNKEMNFDLGQNLKKSESDMFFNSFDKDKFLQEMGIVISYIGSVIIKKSVWISKSRKEFFGTWFVHVGVILSSDLINNIAFISSPAIMYRSGNSSWTSKSFDIWYIKWPNLIWSFNNFSASIKEKIAPQKSWLRKYNLIKSRAMGEFNFNIFKNVIINSKLSLYNFIIIFIISISPIYLLNIILVLYCSIFKRNNLYTIYNLLSSVKSKFYLRTLSRLLFLKF